MPILSQEQVDMIEQLYQSITISRQRKLNILAFMGYNFQ
jgi:hypothetical protein